MATKLSRFKDWLLNKRQFRVAWFAKDANQKPEPEEALSQLPDDMADELMAALNDLPIHPKEKETVLDALDEAITQWRKHPHLASNSVVVLSHPVSSVARILTESLHELRIHKDNPLDVRLLDWVERPPDSGSIKQQIKEKLEWDEEDLPEDIETGERRDKSVGDSDERDDRSADKRKTLAVIPNMCWCFLRSADGLEGVDYLQETLLSDRNQFWAIGTGQVGWEYLKSTLKFHAYCGETIALKPLTGEEIEDWLKPVIDKFEIQFTDAAIHKRLTDPNTLLDLDISSGNPIEAVSEITQEVSATVQSSVRAAKDKLLSDYEKKESKDADTSPRKEYFERLADMSDGVSVVALQLFVKSLRYREVLEDVLKKEPEGGIQGHLPKPPTDTPKTDQSSVAREAEDQTDKEEPDPEKEPEKEIIAVMPKLAPLPELSQSDLYLLYSLMLHGDLTIKALAKSLGDAPQVVNNQVQMLRNAGVIEQKNGVIKTNPVHYPKLRRELSRNNFIIEVP